MVRARALLAAVPLVLGAGWLWTLRDPERQPPDEAGAILAPADGRVLLVETVVAPRWVPGPALHIAVYLNLLDVHVQRAPCAGRVVSSEDRAGGYAPAYSPAAASNHGHCLDLETLYGPVLLVRSAGLIARRVTTSVCVGEELAAGQRVGRILLGSRVDVFLPERFSPAVAMGQKVTAGETVMARWVGAA